jgi:cysteine-S-conjugate beta-lyase
MNDSSKDGRSPPPARRLATRVVTARRDPKSYHGFVNPPVYHASTVLYPSAEDFLAHRARYQYGRRGTPTTEALELALQELEGPNCAGVSLLPSGLSAISTALLSVVQSGDHVLVTDSAYGPTRNYSEGILKRLGVTTSYFDPLIGGAIAEQFRPNTRAVFVESPGSLSFEMQDITAIAAVAHAKGRDRADGQYLGDAAVLPPARPRRRSRHSGRHKIYRRPFRPDARYGVGQ